jgi:hypothetical protein
MVNPDIERPRRLNMTCETEASLRKAFADTIREFDLVESRAGHMKIPFDQLVQEQSAAHLKLANSRLAFMNHKASCSTCASVHYWSNGLVT